MMPNLQPQSRKREAGAARKPAEAAAATPIAAVAFRHSAPGAIVQRATAAPGSLHFADLLSLQRTLGNRAAGAMLARAPMQANGDHEALRIDPKEVGLGSGPGRPLPAAVRGQMEAALGADFSDVRVHVGPQAERVSAIAFTIGSDIYSAPGRYQPDTASGRQLLGHELAHVVQQRAGHVRSPGGAGVAVVQDRALEAQADRLGNLAAVTARSKMGAAPPSSPAGVSPPVNSGPSSQHLTSVTRGGVPKSALIQAKGGGGQKGKVKKEDDKERRKRQDEEKERSREKARQDAQKKEAQEVEATRRSREEAQKKIDAQRAKTTPKSGTNTAAKEVVGRTGATLSPEPQVKVYESALKHWGDGWAAAICGNDNPTEQTLKDYIKDLAKNVCSKSNDKNVFFLSDQKLQNNMTGIESYCSMAYEWRADVNEFHIFHFGPESARTHFFGVENKI
jgi:hypothetical protein